MAMRRVFLRSCPAIIGLFIVIFIGSQLSSSVYHSKLTQYGLPICSIDRHKFENATCEACGRDIMSAGVFFSANVAMTKPFGVDYELSFADYYDSYEVFKSDYDMCLSYSNAVMAIVVLEVCVYVFLFMYSRWNKTKVEGPRLPLPKRG